MDAEALALVLFGVLIHILVSVFTRFSTTPRLPLRAS
jgi:hypothetical protein